MISEAVQVTNKLKVNRLRAQLGLTQQELADRAGVNVGVVWKAENGKRIDLIRAYRILEALNTLRGTEQPQLDIDHLDWNVEE